MDLPANIPTGATGPVAAAEFIIANLQNTRSLHVRLSAMEAKGEGRTISAPRITTLDNTEAYIEQGFNVPYSTREEGNVFTTEFIEAKLKLTVVPHVNADGYIRMEIKVSKDTPSNDWRSVDNVPSIDKKEAKTEVLVKDGEVVVIGGIYTHAKSGPGIEGVPFLYKIPLLGWLFQRRSTSDVKRELLIFIAPSIVQPRRIATP